MPTFSATHTDSHKYHVCSLEAQTNGEDLIGMAGCYARLLLLDLPTVA